MSSGTNKPSENDTGDTYNYLGDLNEDKTLLHKYPNSEVDVMNDEIYNNVILGYDNISSDLPQDSDIAPQKMDNTESNELIKDIPYDKYIGYSSFEVIPQRVTIPIAFVNLNKYYSSIISSNDSFLPLISDNKQANASASGSSQINANSYENIKATTATINTSATTTASVNMPILPETSFERKTKRLYDDSQSVNSKKRIKTCKSIHSQYRQGDIINASITITDEDIKKFHDFKNKTVKCNMCNNKVSIAKLFLVEKNDYVCEECTKKNRMDLVQLRKDLYDTFDYTGEKLFKCRRLDHARPLYQYIKYSSRNRQYRIVTNCCYCRLYKSQENVIKKY